MAWPQLNILFFIDLLYKKLSNLYFGGEEKGKKGLQKRKKREQRRCEGDLQPENDDGDTALGQKHSSDALFTPKLPIFTTLSHCAMSMRISENLSLH